jgi:hypothetical protein
MMPEEKDKLLALFDSEQRWCRDSEASDSHGEPVKFHDPEAVAWDLTGALCRLFGWPRARVLFGQVERHIFGKKRIRRFDRDPVVDAMVALQEYNDQVDTSFETLFHQLCKMPTWQGSKGEQPTHDL